MRKVIFGLLVLALIFFIAQQLGFEDPVASRQVKAIAEPQPNYLLDVEQHISLTPRPKETFPFPIQVGEVGPTQSLYSGENLYPFYCMTIDSKLGQPLVDNQDGVGVPVYDTDEFEEFDREQLAAHLVGYSKDCSLPTQLAYVVVGRRKTLHLRTAQELALSPPAVGEQLLRIEQGTINRYIYTIVMPIGIDEIGSQTSSNSWNQRLIYRFEGGSGIGFRQGRLKLFRLINKELEQLEKGYAVITSSGNKTSYGYNMLLAEDTARRVKTQFVSLFGEPLYTIGIGASGGGLAQYLIGQNSQGILDALMPLYSYPDMISVSTYALDCDLLNNYFSFRADKEQWQDWNKRQAVEGLRAINGAEQKFGWLQPLNQLLQGQFPDFPSGNNECINGYFGLSSYIYNPKQGFIKPFYHDSVVEQVNWHYWQEMAQVFGVDKQGFANSTWDNVGVQYGLEALLAGQISFDEFIDLNRQIGAWKPFNKMQPEQKLSLAAGLPPVWLSLWGNHNITNVTDNPASRFSADLTGIERAYRYGQIFIGQLTLPTIDIRHYLEDELNMHHSIASFITRLRMLEAQQEAGNHVVWVSDKNYTPIALGYEVMDKWMLAIKDQPSHLSYQQKVLSAKPKMATDTCFDAQGEVMAAGQGVFDGEWNGQQDGACMQQYPTYSNSRIKAGGPWQGSIFKCHTISVESAIEKGIYGNVDLAGKVALLKQTFPDGVCDYSLGDMGRPSSLR